MKKYLFLLITLTFITLPYVAYAQTGGLPPYVPLEPLPLPPGVQTGQANFSTLLSSLFTITITVGGLIAVGMLVWYGITYMLSEAVNMKASARRHIEGVFWGLMLLLGSWLILNTINPQLLNLSIFAPLGGDTQTTGAQTTQQNAPTSGNSASYNDALNQCTSRDAGCTLNASGCRCQ